MTLANQLTILRMCLVPPLVILLVYGYFGWALVVLATAGVTDALDGLLARRRRERTQLGTMLDPLADKLLVTASLVVLALPSDSLAVRIPPWIAILSISRDVGILLTVVVINIFVSRHTFAPSLLGKATTTMHLVLILWVIACNYLQSDHALTNYMLGVTAALVVASALHYLYLLRGLSGRPSDATDA